MSVYFAVYKARFLALLQYRAAAAAGFATQVVFGFIRVMIFAAFFRSSTAAQPMTQAEVVTYIWLSQSLLMILPFRQDVEVVALVRSGNVAYEFLRPVDIFSLWFARAVALRTAPTLLRAVPLLLIAGVFFGMGLPAGLPAFGLFALSLGGAILLGSAITALMSISLLYTVSGEGVGRLISVCMWVFSGIIIPLPFLPEWLKPFVYALPFRGLMDTPFRIYLGHLSAAEAMGALTHQGIWIVVLILFGRALLSKARHRIVVQGG
jgi:viologen exporter family transport system permease protein